MRETRLQERVKTKWQPTAFDDDVYVMYVHVHVYVSLYIYIVMHTFVDALQPQLYFGPVVFSSRQ